MRMSTFPAKILAATDGSEDSLLALQAAVDLSNETGAELHLIHVGESHPLYPPRPRAPPRPRRRKKRYAGRHSDCSMSNANKPGRWAAR